MSTNLQDILANAPLGKKSAYIEQYAPELLFPIARQVNREAVGVPVTALPFRGIDMWTAYELSWLNQQGKPIAAIAEWSLPCTSPNLIESKSLKLYFNSFNQTKFQSLAEVQSVIAKDLSQAAQAEIKVKVIPVKEYQCVVTKFQGLCLDDQDVACDVYDITPDFLRTGSRYVEEILYSDLLKSNCCITGQPDWASVQISYTGRQIDPAGLLQYIVSFRGHNEFHEPCVERIFVDIMTRCQPEKLTVYARYTRRGGLDINPYRSTEDEVPGNTRLVRQ
jgi:7-cyano-7-deazaguanine reductase